MRSSGSHLARTVDDLAWDSAFGEPAGVGAVEVVVAEVALQVVFEGGQPGYQRAGEGWPPALLEDRLLQALDVSVGLGPAGADARCSTESAARVSVKACARYSEPLSVISAFSFQPARASSEATRRASAEQCSARGLRDEACSSAQAKPEETSIAVYCQTAPFVPDRRPT